MLTMRDRWLRIEEDAEHERQIAEDRGRYAEYERQIAEDRGRYAE